MSQTAHRDIEGGNNPDGQHDNPQSAPNQPLQGESIFGDSSGPLFSIYSKAAEEEDNKMVERWQKDADGILIFTGLFSAAVAALLAVTVQDLRPNSQDTSAFYLGNIYQVLADPNVTLPSSPTPVAKPPPFSRPRYAVWVNSLWFLSLVMSLSCALWATSLHQWARRYIRLTQPARCSPEKRARIRAFFANGVDKMHVPLAVEGLPTLLHLSLFLFLGGLVIFLFNVDQEVFTCVVLWIGGFSIVYGLVTLLPSIRHDSPYNTPLSITAWFLYARMKYLALKVLFHYRDRNPRYPTHWRHRRARYEMERRLNRWKSVSVEKKAEELAEEQSSEIDIRILGWTISALGDDDSLEKFFEAIPGFFNSKLVKDLERDFPETLLETFWGALDGFIGRTFSSNSVTETVKSRRDIIIKDIMSMIPCLDYGMVDHLAPLFDEAPVSIERLKAMARWFTCLSSNVSDFARRNVIWRLPKLQERDNRWSMLAHNACGFAAHAIWRNLAMSGDDMLLATLICISRKAIHSPELYLSDLLEALTQFDIRHTLPRLQHDFCTLWNELVQETKKQGPYSTPVKILCSIRHPYITLHQGTDAAPTAFSASTPNRDAILFRPSSYPLCDITKHYPDSTAHIPAPSFPTIPLLTKPTDSPDSSPHHPTSGGSTVSRRVKQANVTVGPPFPSDPTTPSEIGDSSQVPAATEPALPVHTSSQPTDSSPPSALKIISPVATLSFPLGGTTLKDIVTPCAEPDTSEILSTASTPAPTLTPEPVPESTPPVLNESSTSCDPDAASASNPLLSGSSVVGFSVPASLPLLNAKFPALDGTTPSRPTDHASLPHIRARGLVNTGSMCFANAVLQLLVHSPPFWNMFRQLGDLKGRRGGGPEPGCCATPLVDAMIRFFEEFVFKEKEQPPTQHTARGKPKEGEMEKKDKIMDSFEPTYLYEAMKEKRQLKHLLAYRVKDGKHDDAEEFLGLCLDALDEELAELQTFISTHKQASVPSVEEFEGEVKSAEGQTAVGKLDNIIANSVESPISRIFGGRSRSTVRVPSQPDTVAIEAWRSLKLYIEPDSVHTIQEALALAHASQPQPVQVGPSSSSEGSQEVLLEALPPVLVLHLERFLYDAAADGIVKISKFVQFAPELEIPLEIMAPVAGKSAVPVHYKLYGVLYHHGESAGSGHYTIDVFHPNGDSGGGEGWLYIDDESVSAVRPGDVFGGHDNEPVDDRCAYMLFYCRTAPAWSW